ETEPREVIDRRSEPYDSLDVRRARLEPVRYVVGDVARGMDFFHHAAAVQQGAGLLGHFAPDVQHAGAARRVELVTAENEVVAIELAPVMGLVGNRLGSVHQNRHARGTAYGADRTNRVRRTEKVRACGNRDQIGAVRQSAPQALEIEAAILGP